MKANGRVLMVTILIIAAILAAFSGQQAIAGNKLNFIDAPGSPIELTDSWSAVIGDFNEDGHLDIAVLCPLYYTTQRLRVSAVAMWRGALLQWESSLAMEMAHSVGRHSFL